MFNTEQTCIRKTQYVNDLPQLQEQKWQKRTEKHITNSEEMA